MQKDEYPMPGIEPGSREYWILLQGDTCLSLDDTGLIFRKNWNDPFLITIGLLFIFLVCNNQSITKNAVLKLHENLT